MEQNKKRLFQILDEMNMADDENKTANVAVCNSLVSAQKVKAGGTITMGVPENLVLDLILNQGKKIPILLMIDRAEYDKKNSENSLVKDEAFWFGFAKYYREHSGDNVKIEEPDTYNDKWKVYTMEQFMLEYIAIERKMINNGK